MSLNNRPIIPFFRPNVGLEEEEAVVEALRSGWLSSGPKVNEFEESFSSKFEAGKVKSIAVNSATAGLHLCAEALGINSQSVIAIPTMTFTTTAEILMYLGAKIILVDSENSSPNMNLDELFDVSSKLNGVIPVHFAGIPVDILKVREIVGPDKIIIEDAAHSIPNNSTFIENDELISDAAVFSFYANKAITTGEGGMVVTAKTEIAKRVSIMRSHGIDRNMYARFQGIDSASWEYDVVAAGYKYNMTDISAAIGLVQLRRMGELRDERQRIHKIYSNAFKDLPVEVTPQLVGQEDFSYHLFTIEIKDESKTSRDDAIRQYFEQGIKTSVHYKPLHQMSYWKKSLNLSKMSFPNADRRFQRTISLPNFPGMQESEIERVISATLQIFES